jgi:ribosome-binding factor A
MPRDPNRTRRMESEIQRVVSELLRREVKDPRVGSITVTAVRVSPDMGHAKIFYLPFERSRDAAALQAGLDGAARFLRGPVGRALKLRVAPELHFAVDEQLNEGMRLTEIIDAAVARDHQQHGDAADDGPETEPTPRR